MVQSGRKNATYKVMCTCLIKHQYINVVMMQLMLFSYVSSDEESEEQINASDNVSIECTSDDEWSSDNE